MSYTNGFTATAPPAQQLLGQSNLTRSQFLLWLGQQIAADTPLYNMIQTFTIQGALDLTAFRCAFQAVVAGSDALRTTILMQNGVPQQQVQATLPAPVELVDLTSSGDPESAYHAWLAARKTRLLALDQQLFDTALVRLAPDRHVWYLCQHHLVTDGVSFALVYKNVAESYALALADRLDEAPALPQYADYVAHERSFRQTDDYQQAVAFWQQKVATAVTATDFYGHPPNAGTARTDRIYCNLGPERSARLRAIAQSEGFASLSLDMSLFTVFATLLATTLHRISGQRLLRLGIPYHGRATADFKNSIGLFIEIGPMQVELDEDETFISLGEKVMAETFAGLMHARPGISSAEANRAYDVLLNFVNASFTDFAGLPVSTEWVHTGYGDSNHKLRLQITDFDATGSFMLDFDVNTAVFDQTRRQWLVDHFLRVVDAFIVDHTRPIGDFALVSDDERQRLLVEFNDSAAPYPAHQTVVALFEAQVARTPDNVAAVRGQESVSYAELNRRANRLAHYLHQQGVGPETAVALCLERSIEVLVAIWAVLKAGGAYVPIDPAYPADRIRYLIEDAAPAIIVTNGDWPLLPDDLQPAIINLKQLDLSDYSDQNPTSAATPDNLAYMIYTSGSTGQPKGTLLTHQGLVNYVWWARRVYQDDGETLDFPLYSSLAFDLTVTSIYVPLLSGGKVVVYSESDHGRGLEVLSVFRDDAVDVVKLTPAHLALVEETAVNCGRIRKLIVGGEDFKTDLAQRIQAAFGGRVEIYNEYGPTEAVVGCMIHRFDPEQDTAVSVPIGIPAANARIYLLDEYDHPVPPGVLGEMVISSDGVARGYHKRPELTAARFGNDPFRPGARIYRTGDLARWNEQGQMVFLGRRDHQVKIRGARIELAEIEARLLAHPAIHDAVVTVVQYEHPHDEDERLYCLKCGLPSNYPNVTFSDDGICNLCRDFDTFRDDVNRYFKTMDDLHAIVARAKAERSGDYDCMMLYSGGKDSTYVLTRLVEMDLKVLAFSLDNGYISEEAKENIRRVTTHLGVDLVFGTTPHMNAIFADSLQRFSNVCQGCYKTIYTLSMTLARQKGINYIFTGLSRGQLFETRLDELFRHRIFDVDQMDQAILAARQVYHRVDDAVYRLLDVSLFQDDRVFGEIQFVDFFRYTDVELEELYAFLAERVPWFRPGDTGRSTNCLINEAGIFVHQKERGYHNYALPYSWDVRLGHKTRAEAMAELDDDIRLPLVWQMLEEVGYEMPYRYEERSEKRLAAYYAADETLTISELRAYLSQALPDYMLPSYFVRLEALPLTANGKVDRQALPGPEGSRPELDATYAPPGTQVESRLAEIWAQTLHIKRIGIHDNFFDLGGASVPAVQVVAKVSDQFGVDFPLRSFFDHPTIARQSVIIEDLLLAQLEAMSDEEAAALLAPGY
jgi:amino acid adenylation domain-containing protein